MKQNAQDLSLKGWLLQELSCWPLDAKLVEDLEPLESTDADGKPRLIKADPMFFDNVRIEFGATWQLQSVTEKVVQYLRATEHTVLQETAVLPHLCAVLIVKDRRGCAFITTVTRESESIANITVMRCTNDSVQ